MKHQNYSDGQKIERKLDEDRVIFIEISAVGIEPTKVSAKWAATGGRSGIAYGGFQDRKDFDFQTAAKLAVENAISQAGAA